MPGQEHDQPGQQGLATDKAQAARLGYSVAEAFNRAASPDPEAAAALRRSLPVVAAKLFQAGHDVSAEILRAHALQGPGHLKALTDGLAAAFARPPPLSYDSILAELKRKHPLQMLLSSPPGEEYLSRYKGGAGTEDKTQIMKAAACEGSLEWVRWLHEHGADIRTQNDAALRLAAGNGHLEVVKYLHEHGADIRAWNNEALRWAAENGHLEVVKYLHEKGANIWVRNDAALRLAAGNGHLEVVKYLHEQGANIRAVDDDALRNAAARGHLEVVKYLHEQGANIWVQDDEALRYAAARGHLEVVKYLREKGADIWVRYEAALIGQKLKEFSAWEEMAGRPPPLGLEETKPAQFHREAFEAIRPLLLREGYQGKEANLYAFHLSALFGTEECALRYLRKWGKHGKQPLHDLAVDIRVPQEGQPDLAAWADAVMKHGPAMAKFIKFADKLAHPLGSVHETRAAVARFAYKRGDECPALAALCFDLAVEEEDFDNALGLYLKHKKRGFPEKRIPDLQIDGTAFSLPGARFRRLAPDDPRGLFLGELTDCCQSIGGAGDDCARHGFSDQNSGFYVIEADKGEIIGQSWAWMGENGELVLDSIETLGNRVSASQWQALLQKAAESLARHPQGVKRLLVGTGGGTPEALTFKSASEPAAPDGYRGYRDSHKQAEIWVRGSTERERKPKPRL